MLMSVLHFHAVTTSTPEQFIAGLTDFGPGRSKIFKNSADSYLMVHRQPGTDLVPVLKQAIRDTLAGHLVKRWPGMLSPNQYAVMVYLTTDPSYELRITVDYEDEDGYRWRRTDVSQPIRTDRAV
jgi:hypothetical protein